MKTKKKISGVIPIIPTPFTEREEIAEEELRCLIEFAIKCGVQAVCLPAYASEYYKLTEEEKLRVVQIAIETAKGRIQIIAQSNHPSLKIAKELAHRNIGMGADIISLAVPRIFDLPDNSLCHYLQEFLKAIPDSPVLLQDFNPSGSTLSAQFLVNLKKECPNLLYLKLEEPLSGHKFNEIIEMSKGEFSVFEGWGGLYMMELIPIGISGIMPGLAVSDILQKVYNLRKNGESKKAFDLFEKVMPQIFFSLQNMELFHYAEKELLKARGILKNNISRNATYMPSKDMVECIHELNDRILQIELSDF